MDTPETLAADLLKAAVKAAGVAVAAVEVGASHIKRDARTNVLKSAPIHNAHAAYAITYDKPSFEEHFGSPTIGTEVGYDKKIRGGSLGSLLEYGSRKSSPHRDLGRALDAEEPRFEDALAKAIEKLL